MMQNFSKTKGNIIFFTLVLFFGFVGTVHAGTLTKPASSFGLVGYWSFNEATGTVATDYSGHKNTGTLQNMSTDSNPSSGWGSGKLGTGLNFDGTNDRVDINNSTTLDPGSGAFAITAWFKVRASCSGSCGFIYNDYGTSDTAAINLAITANQIDTTFRDNSGNEMDVAGGPLLNDGQWHQVAMVRETATTMRVYIDGISIGTGTNGSVGTITASTGNNPAIGDWGDASPRESFSGTIDEVRVYKRTLSATEVANLYKVGVVKLSSAQNNLVKNGLVGWWTFDGSDISGVNAYNRASSAANIGVITGATRINGKLGQALSFNGSNQYVDTNYRWDPSNVDITVSAWVKTSMSGIGEIFGNYANPINNDIELYVNASGKLEAYIRDTSGITDHVNPVGTITINDNKWHHVAVVLSGGTATLYVDGIQDTSDTDTGLDGSYDNGHNIFIGTDADLNNDFSGLIDDARVYNRALSVNEVKLLYGAGNGKVNSSQNVVSGSNLQTGLVGLWSFNGPDFTDKIYDRSGSASNGYLVNAATTTAKINGKLGQGLKLTQSSLQYADMGDPAALRLGGSFTIAGWYRPKSIPSGDWHTIAGKGAASNFSNYAIGYDGNLLIANGNGFIVWFDDVNNATSYLKFVQAITVGQWYYVVGVFNSALSQEYLYVNGSLVAQQSTGSNVPHGLSGADFTIGRDTTSCGGCGYADATIDEVRLYNRALSASEVKQLYLMGK